jgi:hypothetical protein
MSGDRHDEFREFAKKRLRKALAEMNAAYAEVMRLWAEREKIDGPVNKRKKGRPTIWKGFIGFVLVGAVEEILIRKMRGKEEGEDSPSVDPNDPEDYELLIIANRIHARSPTGSRRLFNLAQAIRKAVRTHPILQRHKDVFDRLSDRALQARYQTAADYWSEARRRPREDEYKAATDRWTEAIEEVHRWEEDLL